MLLSPLGAPAVAQGKALGYEAPELNAMNPNGVPEPFQGSAEAGIGQASQGVALGYRFYPFGVDQYRISLMMSYTEQDRPCFLRRAANVSL